ncbi:MAG: ATP-binding protein [Polyangiaceae bacterium]
MLGEHIEISFNAASDLDNVRGDPGQLEQVILNLCVNARDAMPGGGRLTLALENIEMHEEQLESLPGARPGRYVRLLVADTGTGMSADQLKRIFEPFYTTKPTGQGTGLGLSVAQGIVQQHDGFISVYSEVGLGTTFHLYLPSHTPTKQQPTSETPSEGSPSATSGNELILLVEDDAAVRQATTSMLKRQGYRVLVAGDGEEACALAAAKLNEISLVILDVVMPRMGGVVAGRKNPGAAPLIADHSLHRLRRRHRSPRASQRLGALAQAVRQRSVAARHSKGDRRRPTHHQQRFDARYNPVGLRPTQSWR